MTFSFAFNYGGRTEILDAIRHLIANGISPQDIDEKLFDKYISLGATPAPDLLIRTSGEKRISNFLIWSLAYSELYFTSCFWPEFNKEQLHKAIKAYSQRDRRFGAVQ